MIETYVGDVCRQSMAEVTEAIVRAKRPKASDDEVRDKVADIMSRHGNDPVYFLCYLAGYSMDLHRLTHNV